jgi:hypothetical protein
LNMATLPDMLSASILLSILMLSRSIQFIILTIMKTVLSHIGSIKKKATFYMKVAFSVLIKS